MSKPKTLLEDLCEHALSCGAQSIEVEYKDDREWVFARKGETAFGTANFESSSRDAKELRENPELLHSAYLLRGSNGAARTPAVAGGEPTT